MVDKFCIKVTANIAVSSVLIIFYVYFFGQSSVHRYLKKAVYIIEEEEKYAQIPSPGTATVKCNKYKHILCKMLFNSYNNCTAKSQNRIWARMEA